VTGVAPGRAGHVVLVGMMGTGKTTTGRRLAETLGRGFADSDLLIEADTGRTVRQIFQTDGEAAFRCLESEVLARSLASAEPTVIAAAGGIVLDPANRELLRHAGTVVWLRAPVDVLVGRVRRSDHRPAIQADPRGTLQTMEDTRTDLYGEVADATVDSSQPVDRVVAEIVALVREREAGS
jgi:shikimate kinase